MASTRFVAPDPQAAGRLLSDQLVEAIHQALAERPHFHLALSGGSSLVSLAAPLAIHPALSVEDWRRIHLWQVDERGVPREDDRRNLKSIEEHLASRVPIPRGNVHGMPVERQDADRCYEAELLAVLGPAEVRLDTAVLGLGTDGHIASLFPNSPALSATGLVAWNDGPAVGSPRPRLTLTFAALRQTRQIALLVTGAAKRPVLDEIGAKHALGRNLPITQLATSAPSGLTWILDAAAAGSG
jgi:6-phosphogluconolactonase